MHEFKDFADAWRANQALCLEMLAACSDADFELKPGYGKTIRSNFVHLVSVRRLWCEEGLKAAAAGVPKLDWKTANRDEIAEGLRLSSEAVLQLLEKRFHSEKPNRWTFPMFFAYVIAHEAHHRSQIEISWRMHKSGPEDLALYGMWEWHKKI